MRSLVHFRRALLGILISSPLPHSESSTEDGNGPRPLAQDFPRTPRHPPTPFRQQRPRLQPCDPRQGLRLKGTGPASFQRRQERRPGVPLPSCTPSPANHQDACTVPLGTQLRPEASAAGAGLQGAWPTRGGLLGTRPWDR